MGDARAVGLRLRQRFASFDLVPWDEGDGSFLVAVLTRDDAAGSRDVGVGAP